MLEVVAGGDFAFFVFPLSFSAERLGFYLLEIICGDRRRTFWYLKWMFREKACFQLGVRSYLLFLILWSCAEGAWLRSLL